MNSSLNFSPALKSAIQFAQALAKDYQQSFFSPAHLLYALLKTDSDVVKFMESIGKDVPYFLEWCEVRIESYPKAARGVAESVGDDRVVAVMEEADLMRLELNYEQTDGLCVLVALTKPNVAFTKEQLRTFPLTSEEVREIAFETMLMDAAVSSQGKAPATGTPQKSGKEGTTSLHKFCVDKTAFAREGKIDSIIGRDRETRMMIEILGRRTKPNVLIVGEPGVGKTALVDGFALSIVNKNTPVHLQSSSVYELDTGALVAGASYKGEVEDRLKGVIKNLKSMNKAILFIDEIHTLLDPQGSVGSGAANLLKPELARGALTVIGATTNEEYRKFIEPEQAFNRRFEILRVDEPDIITATRMLKELVPYYEEHHKIMVSENVPEEAVHLAKRYLKDRHLPDAAIDLVDRTMAAIRMSDETSQKEISVLQEKLIGIEGEGSRLDELLWFQRELNQRISPILLAQLEEAPEDLGSESALNSYLKNTIGRLKVLAEKKKGAVEKADIAAVVAYKTGIPLGKIQSKEREKLLSMEEILKQRVVGQDNAIKAISAAILESRSGLTKVGQPIGSFFFLGPTGTGKTELAKSLADLLFNDESAMIRFDMSEFKEEHSAALLYGAPPGYIGYKEGGLLVNKIREKPYSVLLFDEVEKAHPSVFDVFLQILDEGKLHDRLGKEGDFSNAVILFTSNIGSEFIIERYQQGSLPSSAEMMDIMTRYFRPEFLARVTEIVPFAPITEGNVVKIFDIQLGKLLEMLHKQGVELIVTDKAKRSLALSGFTPKYGARPLSGVIRNQLRRPLSRMLVAGDVTTGSRVKLDLDEEEKLVWEILLEEQDLAAPIENLVPQS